MHLSEVWEFDRPSARLVRLLLWPASVLYGLGWEAYASIYRLRIKRPRAPHSPVVCVGNLVSGGTGKSPVTVHLAEVLQELGYEVVISASGYGSPSAEGARLAPAGPLRAGDWGDEPAMLREMLPKVPLIVGRRRVLAAEICHREFPNAVLLMDDGFQHLPLRKHLAIVLDPPRENHSCLPAGPYREPRRNRKYADLVIPGDFRIERSDLTLEKVTLKEAASQTPTEAAALTALAEPTGFLTALENQGIRIGSKKLLPDHDPMTAGNLFEGMPQGLPIVCTLKDWVKLRDRPDIQNHEIWVARQTVRIEPQEEFRRWLAARLNGRTQD